MINKYTKIYRQIKKYNNIVIARHIGPDPDALSSQLALRDTIKLKFPEKKVYAVGAPAASFKYLGTLDKIGSEIADDSLLIVLDTPDLKRIDGVDIKKFDQVIKIDHHPFIEKFGDIELVDDSASSAAQLVLELIYKTPLAINKEIGEKLFIGIVSDTNRFLFKYTTPKTFNLVSKLIADTRIDFTKLYEKLYLRPLKESKFQGYIADNMTVTKDGFAYIKITDKILKKYNCDAATAGNMVNNFNYINEIYAWAIFSEDTNNGFIRCSIRSRGPIINEVAQHYGGGGHIFASGARLKDFDLADRLIEELNDVCRTYEED